MYNFLKTLADDNLWFYEYSRTDYQNLYDGMEQDKVHLFVDPITTDSTFSDSGFETKTYSGKLMLLVSSDVDETYSDKYVDYIQPLMNDSLQMIKDTLLCSDFIINKFQTVEVINLFDVNLDGLLINYNISLNV
jgi:hypothetical protein